MKIIDAHTHIYPEKIAEKASGGISAFYDMKVKYNGTAAELLEICERAGVSACVICSVATIPAQVPTINDFIANSAAKSNGRFIGLCALHPAMSEAEIAAEITRTKAAGLRGIKIHPDFQRFAIDDPAVFKIYEAAVSENLPILFHTGDTRYSFSNPARLAKILKLFPRLTAIGAHFGGWSEWGDVDCLGGFENFYVDTSSSLYTLAPNRANALIELFGKERVMFGTDYPMWDADGELGLLEGLGLGDEVKEFVFYRNAERVFGGL